VFTLGEGIRVLHDALPSHKKAFHGTCNESLEDLAQAVIKEIRPGDVIMLKGSRGRRAYRGRLAHVVDALKALGIAPAERAS
jgi:UDP-N-acetylmuramoyl-tripeptide--D-alanyl-D-alanine ligase